MKKAYFLISTSAFFYLATVINVNAQKLPAKQAGSLRSPPNIKIDGKATEWNNKFQAYDHATNVFYTLSNDDDNLYLTIQSTDRLISKKIIAGGVKFTLNTSGKKNGSDPVAITFPVNEASTYSKISSILNGISLKEQNPLVRDSLQSKINTELENSEKEIKITGIRAITDTLISVYNMQGIKACIQFDGKGALTYELAIPIKLSGITYDTKFMYNILLTGLSFSGNSHNVTLSDGSMMTVIRKDRSSAESAAQIAEEYDTLHNSTDLWGDYTLAKK